MNSATSSEFESECRVLLDRYYAANHDIQKEKQAQKLLRLLRASEKPIKGKVDGWAAGIVYAVATDAQIQKGVPGISNSEFEKLMGVRMATVYARAAKVREFITF